MLARHAVSAWVATAVAGQLLFATYVAIFYGGAAVRGDWAAWNEVFPRGYAQGDLVGNLLVAAHVACAAVLVIAGALQLVPAVRRGAPALHRVSGRVFVVGAVIIALGGLGMMAHRGATGDWTQHLALAINALVILICAGQAVRHARARRIDLHRAWALRLWIAFAGVWFFRIGVALWLVVHQRPVGFDPETFSGPFLTALGFGQYVVPLALLELWLRNERRGTRGVSVGLTALYAGLTVMTAAGIGAASLIFWLPPL